MRFSVHTSPPAATQQAPLPLAPPAPNADRLVVLKGELTPFISHRATSQTRRAGVAAGRLPGWKSTGPRRHAASALQGWRARESSSQVVPPLFCSYYPGLTRSTAAASLDIAKRGYKGRLSGLAGYQSL